MSTNTHSTYQVHDGLGRVTEFSSVADAQRFVRERKAFTWASIHGGGTCPCHR